MERSTTDISSFENLRKGGYVYVDKTDFLWRLVSETEGSQFFISRPRRFGKSLMLSTWRVKNEAEAKRCFLLFMQMAGANPQPERACPPCCMTQDYGNRICLP